MHQRPSLLGSMPNFAPQGYLPNNGTQSSTQGLFAPTRSHGKKPVPHRAVGFSAERLEAVGRLFEAQGRTEQAANVFRQIEKLPPTPVLSESSTQFAHVPAPHGAPTVRTIAEPPRIASADPAHSPASSVPSLSVLDSPAEAQQATTGNVHPSGDAFLHSLSKPSASDSAATSSGWRVSPQAIARTGDSETVTVSSSVAAPQTSLWETSKRNVATVGEASSSAPNDIEGSFELPTNVPPRPGQWDKTVEIVPGKFLKPLTRTAVSKATTQSARAVTPSVNTNVNAPESQPLPEAVPMTPEPADEDENDPAAMRIIPNGTRPNNRVAKVHRRIRSELAALQLEHPSLLALLSSEPVREIHEPQVLELAGRLEDPDPKNRAQHAYELGGAGAKARTVMPVLREALQSETDKLARLRLAEAMVKIVADDPDAIDVLLENLKSPDDWRFRQIAAGALAATAGSSDERAIAKLNEALGDPNPRVRSMAALSLGAFGKWAKESVPALEFALANDIPRVKESAAAALSCIRESSQAVAEQPGEAVEDDSELTLLPPRELGDEPEAAFIGGEGVDASAIEPAAGNEAPGAIHQLTK